MNFQNPFDNDKNSAKMNAGRFYNTYLVQVSEKNMQQAFCVSCIFTTVGYGHNTCKNRM